jgi:hypothetical protein
METRCKCTLVSEAGRLTVQTSPLRQAVKGFEKSGILRTSLETPGTFGIPFSPMHFKAWEEFDPEVTYPVDELCAVWEVRCSRVSIDVWFTFKHFIRV